jgi:DNA-binding protein YbaB
MGMFDGFSQAKEMFSQFSEMQKLQKKLAKKRITKEYKGVSVTMDGTQAIKELKISDELMQDKSKLEKTIIETIEMAKKDLQKEVAAEMGMGM